MERYIKFIKSRPQRDKGERHHIIPRSLGGDDHPSNLVTLTPREHWIAHLMLRKMFPKGSPYRHKMNAAVSRMSGRRYWRQAFNSRLYHAIRQEQSAWLTAKHKQRQQDPEMNEKWYRAHRTKAFREKCRTRAMDRMKLRGDEIRKQISETKQKTYKTAKAIAFKTNQRNRLLNVEGRPVCKRCHTNTTTSAGTSKLKSTGEVIRKFRPLCTPCEKSMGRR